MLLIQRRTCRWRWKSGGSSYSRVVWRDWVHCNSGHRIFTNHSKWSWYRARLIIRLKHDWWNQGMTNANMKLIMLDVTMEDVLEIHSQHLDVGEHIVKRVVKLQKLEDELKGTSRTSLLSMLWKYIVRVWSAGKVHWHLDIMSYNKLLRDMLWMPVYSTSPKGMRWQLGYRSHRCMMYESMMYWCTNGMPPTMCHCFNALLF